MLTRICPHCGSLSVHRSSRGGPFKRPLLRLVGLRLYRCWSCGWHYYGSIFRRHYKSRPVPSFVTRRMPLPVLGVAFGLVVLLVIPLLVSSAAPFVQVLSGLTSTESRAGSPSHGSRLVAHSGSVDQAQAPALADLVPLRAALEPESEAPLAELTASAEAIPPAPHRQMPQRETVGNLRSTGEVYVNGSGVPAESVVLSGDLVRTGADGSAAIEVTGKGLLRLSPQTEISLAGSKGYFATLRQGTVNIHSLADVRNFEVRTGSVVVAPDATADDTADIETKADGSSRVTCTLGSIGVIPLEGAKATFLQPGQEADVSPDGTIAMKTPAKTPGVPASSASSAVKGGSGHGLWIALGVGGGAAAGIAAAVAAHGSSSSSASPSSP